MAEGESSVEMLDSLSAYEVALVEFTDSGLTEANENDHIVLFGKDSYLWAAAIAYALTHNTNLEPSDIKEALQKAVAVRAPDIVSSYLRLQDLDKRASLERRLVRLFLINLKRVYPRVEEIEIEAARAYESLVARGLIEDPIRKKVLALTLSAFSFVPFSFTSKTNDGVVLQRNIDALAYSYHYQADPSTNEESRRIKLKIVEAAKIFKKEVIPAFEAVFESLGEVPTDRAESDGGTRPSEESELEEGT